MVRDARSQHRALADTGLAVEDRQAGRHQVRLDQLALSLAAEEEADVQLGVLERRQPLVGRERPVGAQSASSFDDASLESLQILVERNVEALDPALAPELLLERGERVADRPRAVADPLAAPDPVQEDTQAPLLERVAEEEEVAPAQPRSDCDGHDDGDLRLREVVDVVVLADDEALPLASGRAVDAAVDLEDHRAPLERQVGVGVRHVDDRRGAVGPDVQELAAVPAQRDIGDDVEVLACLVERPLERVVEVRRDDQLVRTAVSAVAGLRRGRGSGRQDAVEVASKEGVELVVQRSDPVRERHVLGDVREVAPRIPADS